MFHSVAGQYIWICPFEGSKISFSVVCPMAELVTASDCYQSFICNRKVESSSLSGAVAGMLWNLFVSFQT